MIGSPFCARSCALACACACACVKASRAITECVRPMGSCAQMHACACLMGAGRRMCEPVHLCVCVCMRARVFACEVRVCGGGKALPADGRWASCTYADYNWLYIFALDVYVDAEYVWWEQCSASRCQIQIHICICSAHTYISLCVHAYICTYVYVCKHIDIYGAS